MGAISVLLGFVAIFILVITIVGLINPKFLRNPKNPNQIYTRRQIVWTGLGLFFLVALLGGLSSPKEPDTVVSSNSQKAVHTESKESPKAESNDSNQQAKAELNLGLTPEQFRNKYNALIDEHRLDGLSRLPKLDVKKGSVRDVFQVEINDSTVLTGTVNKDGMLRELTFMFIGGQDSAVDGLNLFVAMANASQVVNPEYKEATGKAITKMITQALEKMDQENNRGVNKIFGDYEYFASASPQMGLWVGISHKDN